jgi:drug/metabolite transporter (DMT)-like permease
VPLIPYLAVVNSIAGAGLLVAALAAGSQFFGLPPSSYAALAGAALIPSLVGHTLLNWSVRRAPAHLVALTILGEPVGASLLAWVLFAERPPALALAGGAVILGGILFGFSGSRR